LNPSIVATLLVSLRRTRAAWPIVAAAGLTCVLATTLLAAGPIYANAVSVAGLHRVLADSPVDRANVQAGLRVPPAEATAADAAVTGVLEASLAGVGGDIVRSARSDTFDLPLAAPGAVPDLVRLGWLEGLADRATLVGGAWPEAGSAPSGGPVPVAVADVVAIPLGLTVGQELALTSRLEPDLVVPVRIVGVFRIDDPSAPAWWDERQVLDGLVTSDAFATHGPFFTTREHLLERATITSTELTWRAFPQVSALTIDSMAGLRTRVADLDARIEAATGGIPTTVTTGLPEILEDAERSLLVSRTGVLVLIVQLAVLAAYAVLLSAALLVEHRRVDTAMLRSRGAGPVRIGAMALIEGLLLTVPAAVLGPLIAVAALGLLDVVGPLVAIGLELDPSVSTDAFLASIAGAAACLVALILPALPTRRSFAAATSGVSRAATVPTGQRLGLDVALIAVAAIGLWQLRHYGAPLTQSIHGAVGIDPLLVAAPAIGLLAGAVVALRLLPLLAGLIERATSRGRGLVSSLGARQLARRPLRYTRAALLLILAMSMGVFAVSYTHTWTASQVDQAGFQVGADVRVEPGTRAGSVPRWGVDQAYASLPGVTARTAMERGSVQTSRSDQGTIIALDADAAGRIVTMRADLADAPLAELLAPLAARRPDLAAVRLAGEPRAIRLEVVPEFRVVERLVFDDDLGQLVAEPVDPASIAARAGIGSSVVVRDATGALHRFDGETATFGGGSQWVTVPLGDPGETTASFAYPLDIVAVELRLNLPTELQSPDATIALRAVEAAPLEGGWQPVAMDLGRGWRLTTSIYGLPHEVLEPSLRADGLAAEAGEGGDLSVFRGEDQYGRGTTLVFAPGEITGLADAAVPAVASAAFLDASATAVGESIPLEIAGVRRSVEIVGAVRAFPTVEEDQPVLVVDLPTMTLLRFEGSDSVDPPDEWWFAVDDDALDATVAALEDRPIDSRSVVSQAARARALATDPVALGIIGALSIGFVAATLFAVVGFVVSAAVSARERVSEFALLRALGLSSGQLSSWLSLENAVLASVSLVAGCALGLVIAWVVLPFVTVTQEARTPFPPVNLDVPWVTIGGLVLAGILALAATILVLAWLLRRIGLAAVLRTGED
jgi:hypothetical protein